jgi:hypothetical protein
MTIYMNPPFLWRAAAQGNRGIAERGWCSSPTNIPEAAAAKAPHIVDATIMPLCKSTNILWSPNDCDSGAVVRKDFIGIHKAFGNAEGAS